MCPFIPNSSPKLHTCRASNQLAQHRQVLTTLPYHYGRLCGISNFYFLTKYQIQIEPPFKFPNPDQRQQILNATNRWQTFTTPIAPLRRPLPPHKNK